MFSIKGMEIISIFLRIFMAVLGTIDELGYCKL